MLQRVAVYCCVLQCALEDLEKHVLQGVAVYCSVLQCVAVCRSVLQCATVCCGVLQCVAVCCSGAVWHARIQFFYIIFICNYVCICVDIYIQCVAVRCSVLQCVVVCCSVLQRVAVCCSVLLSVNKPFVSI